MAFLLMRHDRSSTSRPRPIMMLPFFCLHSHLHIIIIIVIIRKEHHPSQHAGSRGVSGTSPATWRLESSERHSSFSDEKGTGVLNGIPIPKVLSAGENRRALSWELEDERKRYLTNEVRLTSIQLEYFGARMYERRFLLMILLAAV